MRSSFSTGSFATTASRVGWGDLEHLGKPELHPFKVRSRSLHPPHASMPQPHNPFVALNGAFVVCRWANLQVDIKGNTQIKICAADSGRAAGFSPASGDCARRGACACVCVGCGDCLVYLVRAIASPSA